MPFPPDIIRFAQAAAVKWQVPASLTLAQWGLESAYGRSMPPGSNNPFGIKALPGQPAVSVKTGEVIHGKAEVITAPFRKFASIGDAFDEHARLLRTGAPYAKMMAQYLVDRNVNAFARALTGVYATAPTYGATLISIMQRDALYQYDHDPLSEGTPVPVTPAPASTTPAASVSVSSAATAAASMPSVSTPAVKAAAPTVGQAIHIDWGSWLDQMLIANEDIVGAIGAQAYQTFAPPMVQLFIGPMLIKQYIGQAMAALGNLVKNDEITVSSSNVILATAANLINANEASFAKLIGDDLSPMIQAELQKLGLVPKAA